MAEFTPRNGEQVGSYDVTSRLDTDYYAVFADIPEDDRAVWDRAKAYIDEVGTRMQDAWDTADYPLDIAKRMGEGWTLQSVSERHAVLSRLAPDKP